MYKYNVQRQRVLAVPPGHGTKSLFRRNLRSKRVRMLCAPRDYNLHLLESRAIDEPKVGRGPWGKVPRHIPLATPVTRLSANALCLRPECWRPTPGDDGTLKLVSVSFLAPRSPLANR